MPRFETAPDDALLRQFLLGELSPADAEDVKQYLEEHPADSTTLDALAANDTFVERLRECPRDAATPSPIVSELISRIERLPRAKPANQSIADTFVQNGPALTGIEATGDITSPTPSKGSPESLDFLSPPAVPGELGQLGGHRILRILGSGGMGMVFEARDAKLDRRVALKVMRPNFAQNATAKDRFLREAKAAAKIEDDHIIPIFQVGEANNVPFLTMPMLKGESLDDRLKTMGTLPVAEVIRIGREIAQGLAAAHEHGLIHRDIKPANIWLEAMAARVGGHSRVKILDFGLARSSDPEAERGEMQLTQSGTIIGTPAYMAPEQARGMKVDARTDLFSLGVVLYRMATGQLPFKGNDTMSQILSLATDSPTHPNLINPILPDKLADLIMHLLEKEPDSRIASAQKVVAALAALESAPTVETTAPLAAISAATTKKPAARSERKKSSRIPIIAVAVLFLLVGGAFALYEFVIKTPNGTFMVQIDDKEIETRFKNGELQILDKDGKLKYTLKPGERSKDMPPGTYRIRVVGVDGLTVDVDEFTMKNGDKVSVRVTMLPDGLAKVDPAKVEPKVVAKPPAFATLDHLDPAKIPAAERFDWQPTELVAVVGEHCGRHWGNIGSISFGSDSKSIVVSGDPSSKCQIFDAQTLHEKATFGNREIEAALYSPDGRTIITAWTDLWLWDATGPIPKKKLRLTADLGGGGSLAISKDGKTLAVGSHNGSQIWDIGDETPRKRFVLKARALRNSLAPDGKTLVTYDGKDLRLWDISTDEPKERAVLSNGNVVAFSDDGKTLATTSSPAGLQFWDLSTPSPKKRAYSKDAEVLSLAFSPDGKSLAWSGGGLTTGLHIVDLTGPEPLEKTHIKWRALGGIVAYSPDGKSLAMTLGVHLRVWDVTGDEPQERVPLQGNTAELTDAVVSPDGKTLATNNNSGQIYLWNITGGTSRPRAEIPSGFSIAFSADSKTLATGDLNGKVQLWDLTKDEPELRTKFQPDKAHHVRQIAFSPDGKILALYDHTGPENRIRVWDITGEEPKEKFILPECQGPFVFGPDGTTLICGKDGKNWMAASLQIWDISGKEPKKISEPFGGPYFGLALAPSGKTLASFESGKGIKLWDSSGAKPKFRSAIEDPDLDIHYSASTPAYAPDGNTLAYANGVTVSLWSVDGVVPKRLRKWQFPGAVAKVSFAPDGRHLITANANGTAYILRLTTGP